MKKIFYLIFVIILNASNADSVQNELFIQANNYMIIQKYNEAIITYEKILDMGFISSELFYNIGNAYYRNNNIGLSIWAYLSSLKLKPRNEDTIRNLSIAQSKTKYKVELPKNIFIFDKYKKIKSILTLNEFIFVGGLIFLIISTISFMDKVQFFRSIKFINFNKVLIFVYLLILIITIDKYRTDKNKKGVIIKKSTEAFSGPEYGQNKVIFRLNEGVIFNISNEKNNWLEITLIDGTKCWVEKKSSRVI